MTRLRPCRVVVGSAADVPLGLEATVALLGALAQRAGGRVAVRGGAERTTLTITRAHATLGALGEAARARPEDRALRALAARLGEWLWYVDEADTLTLTLDSAD